MTKDRTSEMIKLMRANNLTTERENSIHVGTSESIIYFLEQVERCRNEIQSMKDQIGTLKRCHSEIQRTTNENTRKYLQNRVEEKKTVITSSIIAIRNNLKSVQSTFAMQKISPALRRIKEVQINSLIRTLNEITEDYYNCLVDHSEKCKKILYDMISITNVDKAEFEDLVQKGKIAFFTNNLLLNELEQKINFRNLEDRHKDILKIEQSILELKNLTQDLSLVIAIQGEKVEYVEKNVQNTSKKADNAARIIKSASKIRSKTRKRKLIITLLCTSVTIIIIILLLMIG